MIGRPSLLLCAYDVPARLVRAQALSCTDRKIEVPFCLLQTVTHDHQLQAF